MTSTSHVLARKYRPQTFSDLIGQDVLVQTITHAIEQNRLAHAYMLTGIRGIGKTTSARIIAKGLNCIGPDGNGGMTPNPCGKCRHCLDIMNDAHIDVVEIDAASNTGIDNVRDVIIEGAKYNPVSARFKIYIIDEVHMLSKPAFNALLKTLEEPPERVKFIFATTEVRKVPVTILSRCQRFDLKRIDEQTLTKHLQSISLKENVTAEETALQLIAKAGDGSVRDSLSLLDQAMAQFGSSISVDQVRQMLGLADKTVLFDLYESMMKGDVPASLQLLETQYESGADPMSIATDLLDLTHWLTRLKLIPDQIKDVTIPETQRVRGADMAERLTMAQLTRAWQLLLKGMSELKIADAPLKALEMLIVRVAFASSLPTPAEAVADIKKNGLVMPVQPVRATEKQPIDSTPVKSVSKSVEPEPAAAAVTFQNLSEISALSRQKGHRILAYQIDQFIHPIRLTEQELVCSLGEDAPAELIPQLNKFLSEQTGTDFKVVVQETGGAKTNIEIQKERQAQQLAEVKAIPAVQALTQTFSGIQIKSFKPIESDLPEIEEES